MGFETIDGNLTQMKTCKKLETTCMTTSCRPTTWLILPTRPSRSQKSQSRVVQRWTSRPLWSGLPVHKHMDVTHLLVFSKHVPWQPIGQECLVDKVRVAAITLIKKGSQVAYIDLQRLSWWFWINHRHQKLNFIWSFSLRIIPITFASPNNRK